MGSSKKKCNIYKIQPFQSTSLQMIARALHYIFNHILHSDFKIHTAQEVLKISYKLFRSRLTNYSNPLIFALNSEIIPGNPPRKL